MKKDFNRIGATLCSSMRPRSSTTSWLNKFKLLALVLTTMLSINQVWGETVTYTHDFTTTISNGDNTLSTITWTASGLSNVGSYNSGNYKGVQIGTSSKTGAATLTSKNNWGAQSGTSYDGYTKVKKVYVWMNAGEAGSITATVTIGGKSATSDGTTVAKNSSASSQRSGTTKVTFTPAADGETGQIVIALSKATAKKGAGYLCAIQVECEDAAPAEPFTVTFYTASGQSQQKTESAVGAGVIPPSMESTCGDYTFIGWSKTERATEVTTATSVETLTAGKYYPQDNNTILYPVYRRTVSGTPVFDKYEKVTTAPSDWSGKYLLSTGTITFTGQSGSNTYGGNTTLTPGSTEKTEYEVVVEKTTNGYSMYHTQNKQYLGHTSNSNALNFNGTFVATNYEWTFNTSTGAGNGIVCVRNDDYALKYNSSSPRFACYTSAQTMVYLYKRVEKGGNTDYFFSYPDCGPSTYTVDFVCNGGTECPSTLTGQTNLPNPLPTTQQKTGYSFGGWYTNSELTTPAAAGAPLTADVTLYAKWTGINPTISAHPASATYTQNAAATALSVTASLSSGTISYQWQSSTNGTSGWTNVGTNSATYTPSTATVGTTYYRCVVTNITASVSANSSSATITVNAPAEKYRIFVCPADVWVGSYDNGSVSINYQRSNDSWSGVQAMTLTGFDNGGKKIYGYEMDVNPNTGVKTLQFVNLGDYYGAADWGNSRDHVYHGWNGSSHEWTDIPATSNASAVYLVGSFNGWTNGDANYALTKVDNNHWTGTFVLNGASSNYEFKVYAVDNPSMWAYMFSANGYHFTTGATTATQLWTNNSNDQIVPLVTSGRFLINVEYFGNYDNHGQLKIERANLPQASYAKGGSDVTGTDPATASYVPGEQFTLPTNPYTRNGYDFAGWNDGTSTYNAGATYTMGITNVTLTAQWSPKSYTLTWNFASGQCSGTAGTNYTAPGSVACGTTITYPTNAMMSKTGYDFTGWSPNPSTMPANATTITAQWAIKQYSLTVASVGDVDITATAAGGADIAEGSSANVDYNKTVTLNYSNLTDGKGLTWKVYKTGDESTTVSVSGAGKGATFTMPAYPVTVAAIVADLPTWTITLNTGSGTLASGTTEIVVVQGQSTTLPSCEIDCEDSYGEWEFAGWKTGSGVGAITTTAQTFVETNYTPSSDITLYAVYKAVKAGGVGEKTSETFNIGTTGAHYTEGNVTWTPSQLNYAGTNYGFKNDATLGMAIPADKLPSKITLATLSNGNSWASGVTLTIKAGDATVGTITTLGSANGSKAFDISAYSTTKSFSIVRSGGNTGTIAYVRTVAFEYASEGTITNYWSIPCNEKYTMTFHGVGGDASSIDWTGSLGSEDDYMELNATTITAYPTCATAETGWTFLGWRTSDYNDGKELDEESASTDDPGVSTIYNNGKGFALNSGTTEPCSDGVRCVDMYPVFTKFVENDKPEIATLASGSKYYMYYTSDAAGYQDDYSSLDGQTTRIYAHTFSSASFSSTTTCASAQLFEFTKRADGNWDIRMRNAADDGYVNQSYIYTVENNTDLYTQKAQPDHGWVIETITIGGNTMVKMQYAGNTNPDRFMKVLDGGGSSASGTFKNYDQDCAGTSMYHAIYLGSCSNRIFSSNPGHAATWEVYGDFTDDGTANFVGYPMTNGMLVVPNLAANTTYQFKLRKTTDGGSNYTWFGDANEHNTYTTSGVEWTLNGESGGHNVNLLTGAAGSYTFTASHMSAQYPGITVTYPTAYTITFDGNGNDGGSMTNVTNIAAGDDVALPTPGFTKTDWNCIGWTADVDVTVNSATITAGNFIPKTATIEDIHSNITLTAVWEQLVITQADDLYEVVVGGTLQLTLTAYYSPNIATGATYTWATNDTRFATVDNTGLVTGHQAVNSGEFVQVTSSFGTLSNGYNIVVKSAACEQWGLHYWNTNTSTFGDLCFEQVGETNEWRTDEEHLFALPSNSDAEKIKVLYNGTDRDKSKEWTTRWVPMIGLQGAGCGGSDGAQYAGQDAIGYFRIHTNYTDENYFLAFQPVYAMTFGVDGQAGWVSVDFAHTNGAEYGTEIVEIPSNFSSLSVYVGTKRAESNPGVNFIGGRSKTVPMNAVPNMTSGDFAGKFGKFYIHDNYCNESNFDLHFTQFYRLHYELGGGEGTGDYSDQFAWSGATTQEQTFTLETAPTKEGYTFLGWDVNSTTMQPGVSVTLSDDVTATAIWAQNYTVTYDLDGYSTSCSGATTHYCGETVTVCEAPEAVTGYTFGGWKTTSKINDDYGAGAVLQPGTTFVMPCERVVDVIFTAKLTANQYNIIYKDQNDATFSGQHETGHPTKHTYDSETTLKSATKTGYEFGGWYKDAACEGAVVTTLGATEYTADITLYAKWTVNSYFAILDANGGTGAGRFDFTFGGTTIENFTSTIARAGYDLNGFWSAASGGTQILNNDGTRTANYNNSWITIDNGWVKADNDGVLYAHWTARTGIPYTVEYYQMGLNGTYPATATETKGGTGTAGAKVTPTPKEYTGFTTPAAIEATIAGDGSTVVKYYYVRHQHAFAWEFNSGVTSGTYTPANPNMYFGAPITYPAIAKEGYAFLGWSSTDATMPDADLTITAQWGAYENYRTYCGDAVTFKAQNSTDPEEEYVVTTDNGKITTPTLAQTGFTQPEGWVLLGWTKVGDDTKNIVELGKTNVAVTDGDVYNAVWTHIAITGNVLTTSAVGVQVGTTIHVEGTTNNAYGLRVSFVDTKGTDDTSDDVTYGSATGQTAVTQSDFRLASTSYIYIDGSIIQIEGDVAGDTHNQDYNVVYTPQTANEIDNYVLQIQVMKTSATPLDGAVYTLNLRGRALPENFVIAEYLNDKWYALPADMSGSNTYAGKEITVEGTGMDRVVTNATLDMVYSMKTYNFDRSHVLFQSQFNQGHLWAATGDATGINDYAKTVTSESSAYSWMPTPQDATLDTYVMSNVNNTKTLVLNSELKFGMYAKASTNTNIVYFIPLKAEEYVEKEMMMVEWFPTKVLIEVEEDALTGARAKVNNVEVADVTASDTKYGTHLYEITGLNTLVDNAAKKLTILYTKDETTYGHEFDIPIIVSNKTYILSSSKAENKFPWTQAVYNTADLVVRDNSVLTVDGNTYAANTFGNVTIYPTSKVIVPAKATGDETKEVTMTTTTMTLFGGTDEIYNGSEYTLTKYGVPQLVLNGKLEHSETTSGLVYDVRLDAAQYYNFALPYTSKYELVTDNKGGEDFTFWTKIYDGETRAAGNNGWVWYDWDADPWAINIGTGYMFAAQPYSGQNYIIIRHPMGYSTTGDKYAQNEGGHQSGTAEATKAAVDVYAYPSKYDNNAGWNYIANPFMANFTKDLDGEATGTIQTGMLVEHKVNDKWDGHYDWEAGSMTVRYVTLYNNGTDTYTQLPMSTAVLAPFTGFFVQIAKDGQIVFDIEGRVDEAPARMLSEDELPSEMEIFLHAAGQGQKDETVLFLSNGLQRGNAKEFPNEMTKQENAGTLNFYTYGGETKMFANGMSYTDGQTWSNAGLMVAKEGSYTFSVTGADNEHVSHVILRDKYSNTEYDLKHTDAEIYLEAGEVNDRFDVKFVLDEHGVTTELDNVHDNNNPEKFIYNDKMFIRVNGRIYDATGKRVNK